MSKSLFDEVLGDAEIDIDCPECEKSFSVQLNQIGTAVTCPFCGSEIELEADENFLDDAKESLDELECALGSF